LLTGWLRKKAGLNSSRKNSAKRATLSQSCLAWHSGNVTTAVYQPMSFSTLRVDFGWRKKRAALVGFV